MGELGETPNSLDGGNIIKNKAIKRHSGVIITPGISDDTYNKSRGALRILEKDTRKPIIGKLIDRLDKDRRKNKDV